MQPSLLGQYKLMVGGVLFAAMLAACVDTHEGTGDVHQHTAGSGVAATSLGTASLGNAESEIKWGGYTARVEGPTTLTLQEITFQPGGHTGWHTHGGMALVTIVQGALTLYTAHAPCTGVDYPAGTAFLDPGAGNVHIARNLGSSTAMVRVQYINKAGTAIRIDADAPPGSELCP